MKDQQVEVRKMKAGDGEKISDTQRYKMTGNAVTTNVITEIVRSGYFGDGSDGALTISHLTNKQIETLLECEHGGNVYRCRTCIWETVTRIVKYDGSVELRDYMIKTQLEARNKALDEVLTDVVGEDKDCGGLENSIKILENKLSPLNILIRNNIKAEQRTKIKSLREELDG